MKQHDYIRELFADLEFLGLKWSSEDLTTDSDLEQASLQLHNRIELLAKALSCAEIPFSLFYHHHKKVTDPELKGINATIEGLLHIARYELSKDDSDSWRTPIDKSILRWLYEEVKRAAKKYNSEYEILKLRFGLSK